VRLLFLENRLDEIYIRITAAPSKGGTGSAGSYLLGHRVKENSAARLDHSQEALYLYRSPLPAAPCRYASIIQNGCNPA